MIKLSPTTYLQFAAGADMNMILSGWSYTEYFGLFIIYKKPL